MTVQELLDEFMKVEDKTTPVFYVPDINEAVCHKKAIERAYLIRNIDGSNPEVWITINED